MNLPLYKKSEHVMIFYPMGHEVNLLKLLQNKEKMFYLPRVRGVHLECCPYKNGDELTFSSRKIYEPCESAVDSTKIELIFVPALAADYEFNRLGYGGGFYDRFLACSNASRLIPIPKELLFKKIPVENHDIQCDGIITQEKASFMRGSEI